MQKRIDLKENKAALYVRVSTSMQVDKDSLPLQKSDLINYAKYALSIEHYEIFEDAGYSAKNTDRPAYQHMMSRLRTGEFSHLVVWKIDRISRNLIDFATMYDELKQLGIVFVSKNEQFDTSNAMGEAMLKIILVFAELERKMTSERVTAVMISRAQNGQWNGGQTPYGYDWDKQEKALSVNKTEAEVVQSIYDLYEEKLSILQVTKIMNDKLILTRKGHRWSSSAVSRILTSPFYIGNYLYNQHDSSYKHPHSLKALKNKDEWIFIEDHHPAIIEKDQWDRVQSITKSQRNYTEDSPRNYSNYSSKHVHIFSNLLDCGYCGSRLSAIVGKKRTTGYIPSVYLCTRHRRFSDCPAGSISDTLIGPFVFNYISNIMRAKNNIGLSTSLETFQRKLLRGEAFSNVKEIERDGLNDMLQLLLNQNPSEALYKQRTAKLNTPDNQERDFLLSERNKTDRALVRLRNLYLYSEDSMSEANYILEQKKLTDEMEKINKRLKSLDKVTGITGSVSDEEFLQKAEMFVMSQQLTSKRYVDFLELAKTVDAQILKNFLQSIIQNIVIKDRKITSILFKNGVLHKFIYKDQ